MILSVIIPAYNMEAYLAACLTSVRAARPDYEILIVNDGSTDGTSAIAHEFERRNPGVVRVIDKVNGHYGSCINAALPLARGEYIKILDADDTFDSVNFAVFLDWLRGLPDRPDMIISDYVKVKPSGRVLESCSFPLPVDRCFTPDEAMVNGGVFVQMQAVTHRRENLLKMGYRQLEGVPYTDFQWALAPIVQVEKIAYFPKVLTRYLVGRAGQSVDPAVITREADVQARVSLALYRAYREARAGGLPCCAKYYAAHILRNYAWMAQLYALGQNGILPDSTGADFDREVASLLPEIHAAAEAFTIGRGIPFHYIRAWRRDYSRSSLKFRLYRLRASLLRCFHPLSLG